jgi:hypothetical protein
MNFDRDGSIDRVLLPAVGKNAGFDDLFHDQQRLTLNKQGKQAAMSMAIRPMISAHPN